MSDENLTDLLAKREHARPNRLTWVLLAALLLMIGGVFGAVANQKFGPATAAGFPGPLPAMPAGLMSGSQAGASDMTLGKVKLVDGRSLYITTTAGETVKVTVPETASVTEQADISLADLSSGSSVAIRGIAADDGTVTATSVSEQGTLPTSPAQGAN